MANKSANLYARIEPDVKEQAEKILLALGISASTAISLFYKQIIFQRGIPFEVKIPEKSLTDFSLLSKEDFNSELEKGYADLLSGKVTKADEAFSEIRRDYAL